MKKTIQAIKFRNFCCNNKITAQDLSNKLSLQKSTIYKYWAGDLQVPDYAKKILEKEFNLPIYEVFFNDSFDNEYVTVKKKYLSILEFSAK